MSENQDDKGGKNGGGKKLTPEEEMTRRVQGLAADLVKAAQAPDTDEDLRREEAQDLYERRIAAAYHAARKRPDEPPGTPLADLAALREHLERTGVGQVRPRANGLHVAEPPIDIDWEHEHRQVRFTTHPSISVTADRKPAVAGVVAEANALSNLQVWRTEPRLTAEFVAVMVDGAVWTRDVDRAIKVLKTTLDRDLDNLRKAAGGA